MCTKSKPTNNNSKTNRRDFNWRKGCCAPYAAAVVTSFDIIATSGRNLIIITIVNPCAPTRYTALYRGILRDNTAVLRYHPAGLRDIAVTPRSVHKSIQFHEYYVQCVRDIMSCNRYRMHLENHRHDILNGRNRNNSLCVKDKKLKFIQNRCFVLS